MKITVLLFGIIKDVIGENMLKLDLEKATSIGQLKQDLLKKHNNLHRYDNFSIAVNAEYADATMTTNILKKQNLFRFGLWPRPTLSPKRTLFFSW